MTALVSLLVICGCRGQEEPAGPVPGPVTGQTDESSPAVSADQPGTAPALKPWDPSLGTAKLTGVVTYVGASPKLEVADTSTSPECARLHRGPIVEESIVVNPNGTLKHVFVWVKKGLEAWQFPAPSEPVVLDQKGCVFTPHVFGVRIGQEIQIRNSDPTIHNVHALPKRNAGFNFTQAQQGMQDIRSFLLPETMLYVRCDMHPWMKSYANVVPHPYFAVTGDDGAFVLASLPPGEYKIEAVHEVLGAQITTVSLGDNEAKQIEFSFGK